MAADANIVITHITTGAVAVAFLNWLKSTRFFPWLTDETVKLNRLAAIALAAVRAVGINYTWNPADHSVLITGLTLAAICGGAWHWLQSYVVQQMIYRASQNIKNNATAAATAKPSATVSPIGVAPADKPA